MRTRRWYLRRGWWSRRIRTAFGPGSGDSDSIRERASSRRAGFGGGGAGLEGEAGSGPGGRASLQDVDVGVPDLAEEGGGDRGSGNSVAAEDDVAGLNAYRVVALLGGLAAGIPPEAGYVTGLELFYGSGRR